MHFVGALNENTSIITCTAQVGSDWGQVIRKSTNVLPVCEPEKNEKH